MRGDRRILVRLGWEEAPGDCRQFSAVITFEKLETLYHY